MITDIRYVQTEDEKFWYSLDRHLPRSEFSKKVREKMGYVISMNGSPIGILRYNLFWDNTPFCNMIYIIEGQRERGFGKKLTEYWEKDMKAQGYGFLLTSSRSDERAQFFYRRLGYKDCGGFLIDAAGYEQPMELFFIKAL